MSRTIKFGLLGPMFSPIDKALQAVIRMEALGWDFVDFADQIGGTHPIGLLAPPVPKSDPTLATGGLADMFFGSMEMCSAAAVLTKRMGIVLGVIDPLRRSPAVMAQEMATLAHMSQGRISFAIGSGEAKQFEPYGETRVKPVTKMIEAINIWQALWRSNGKVVTRDSEFWPLKEAYFPIPLHEGRQPGLLMCGAGEKVYRLTGEVADGWLTVVPASAKDLGENITYMKKLAADKGRDPSKLRFNAMVMIVLAENDEIARRQIRTPPCIWLTLVASTLDSSNTWKKFGVEHPFGDFNWSTNMRVTLVSKDDVAALTDRTPEPLSEATFVWGGPEKVANQLQEYVDAGINEFMFMNLGANADPEYSATFNKLISNVMERLGQQPLNLS